MMVRDIFISVIAALVLFLIWVAVFDTNRFTISKYTYSHPSIRREFTAVVLSDLHNKKFGKDNARLLEAINQASPDMILIAGDMINGHPNENIDGTLAFLKDISSKYPVYYENGNHEMRLDIYRDKYGDQYDDFCEAIKEYGINLLVNERVRLSDYGVTIIGSEINKKHYKRLGIIPMEKGELLSELGEPDKEYCNILLAHNPDFFEDYAEFGADIVFSGHVHGGIVRIPFINKGVLSPNATFFPKYYQGEYKKGSTTMIVSRGLGFHTIPFRIFNPGDLVVVSFAPEKDNK